MPTFDPVQNFAQHLVFADATDAIFKVSLVGMLFCSFYILRSDFQKMNVKMWQILFFILFGFIGLFASKFTNGTLSWAYAFVPFIYAILTFLNTKLNHNRIVGQADLDIFNGVLAIIPCVAIDLWIHDFGEYTTFIRVAKFCGLVTNMLTYLLVGFILAIVCAFLKWAIQAVRLKLNLRTELKKKIVDANLALMNADSTLEKKINDIKSKYAGNRLRKTKIPVCISFVPAFIATVYFTIYL